MIFRPLPSNSLIINPRKTYKKMDQDTPTKIMVVDDEATTRMVLALHFADLGFDVIECESGEDCLAKFTDDISILMLDVGLPGIDGIETCRRLREDFHDKVQVIFISAHDDLPTRLKAYDVGGNDFIVKPFEEHELVRKVLVAKRNIAAVEAVSGQARYAQAAAFTAMSSMGEMGIVLDFVRKSFACQSYEELVAVIFDNMQQFGLSSLLEIEINGERHCFSATGPCTPLETSILENSRQLQRIFQFSNRLVINYPLATLLLTSMPLHDPDLCGRLRDHLAVVVECAHTRIEALIQQETLKTQNRGISDGVASLMHAIESIEQQYAASRSGALSITSEYMDELENSFLNLGLTDSQENRLVTMARSAVDRLVLLLDNQQDLEDKVKAALNKLSTVQQ
jgi:CheY-like chemotaxis protein